MTFVTYCTSLGYHDNFDSCLLTFDMFPFLYFMTSLFRSRKVSSSDDLSDNITADCIS